MSDSDLSIIRAIEDGLFLQAQGLLQKKLKKYPNKLYYHALQNYILFKQGSIKEAIQESLKLKEKTPSDPEALKLLYGIFKSSPAHQQDANQVFENAIKKYASNDLILAWFDVALKNFDLRAIQKSTMALQKHSNSSANSRKYTLWASFGYYLVLVNDPLGPGKLSESERALFPRLALKLLEPLKPFISEQEIYLLVKLLRFIGEDQQAVSEIEAHYGGDIKGKKLDLELQIILLELYDKLADLENLYNYSHQILFDDKLDDFDTWKYFIKASVKLNKGPIPSIKSRNSYLAQVVYGKEISSAEKFNESIAEYYQQFKAKLCCFNDIKYFYNDLHFDKAAFISILKDSTDTILEDKVSEKGLNVLVNNQKLLLLLEGPTPSRMEENFKYYNLFNEILSKKEETDYFAGDEFILMNVQLILSEDIANIESIFKCIIILENAARSDLHESRLRLWLMKLYSYVSCHTLANDNFTSLKIKMIQNDTLSYYVNTRISTLNPNQIQLQQYITGVQKFYLTAAHEIEDMFSNGFEKLALNKIQGFFEFAERINQSVTYKLNLLEMLRTSKIIGNNQLSRYSFEVLKSLKDDTINKTFDNRDCISEWKFGIQETNEMINSKLSIGPQQEGEYFNAYYLRELILQESLPERAKIHITKLNKILSDKKIQGQLSTVESWTFKIYMSLFKFFLVNPNNDADFNFLVKNLTTNVITGGKVLGWSNSKDQDLDILTWRLNHKFINILELTRNITLFTTIHKLPKQYQPKVLELKKINTRLFDQLKEMKVNLDKKVNEKAKTVELDIKEWAKDIELVKDVKDVFAKINTSLQTTATSRRV